jgi:SNF2 family DNA or RNA helicase
MARPFTSRDAKRLIDEHRELKTRLSKAEAYSDHCKVSISKASEALVAQEVLNVLKDIPIDEINRDKRGFRVKALRDYGYNSIADISTASVYTIASVHGISEDTAYSIKRVVDDIVSKARQGVKIRLSVDNKNVKATELVSAISRYKRGKPYTETCRQILNSKSKQIDYALEDLSPAKSGFKWFFTSSANKQKAIEAYNTLGKLLESEYSKEAQAVLESLDAVNRSTGTEDWQNFSENSISFFNVLEDVNPGILGTDDAMYGLPEDLAREIQEECFFPEGLLCELRRYQEWGVKYTLHQSRVLLGDEMGLGKTIQAIAAMVSLRNTGATHFVVVCPASVITNWCREIRKMSLLTVTKIHGGGRASALKAWLKSGGVAVTTYETTSHFKMDTNFKFTLLVVDEAHYIKNPEARRTVNVKNISNHAERLLFMTGTALENKVDEMISLIQILQPTIAAQVAGMAFMASAPQFREKVAPVYYRRKREDVLTELPELIESKEWCTMLMEEEQVYEQAILSKRYADARRVSWNVDDLQNSSKAKRLLEIIEEAEDDGRKVIVFSFFLDTIRKITELLGNKCLNPINGSVTPQRRQEIIDEFDKAPAGTVLAAQIQSGGTGLNIQSASVVILCEPQFKPSIENQAISRAYRMGQARNVLVYRLLCENTVDEKITSLLESKQAIFDAFADKSVAAKESLELDDKKFGDIIKEEIERINAKHGKSAIKDEVISDEEVS